MRFHASKPVRVAICVERTDPRLHGPRSFACMIRMHQISKRTYYTYATERKVEKNLCIIDISVSLSALYPRTRMSFPPPSSPSPPPFREEDLCKSKSVTTTTTVRMTPSRASNEDEGAPRVRCANDPDLLFHGQVEFEEGGDDSDDDWGVSDTSGTEPVEHAFTFRRSRGSESDASVLVPESEAEVCGACGGCG